MGALTVSIVIPTKNRCAAVQKLLGGLAHQGPSEIIVVDDGSTDGTAEELRRRRWPVDVHVLPGGARGAAAARNTGARRASGDVLLFLDDDLEPEPGLVDAHRAAHDRDDIVALGDLPPRVDISTFMGVMLQIWWSAAQQTIRRPGHRYSFRDLLSGHFSIRRSRFEELGGFDQSLGCREDYELGYRAVMAGLTFRFVPEAVAWHHDSTDVAKAVRRKFDEGRADVQLIRRHPAMAGSLPLGYAAVHTRRERLFAALASTRPRTGDVLVSGLARLLPLLEWLKLRWRWRGVLDAMLTYWYWRGVCAAATPGELAALGEIRRRQEDPVVVLDLAEGLEPAERMLDQLRPSTVRLAYGNLAVNTVPEAPGFERLRGTHLRRILAKHCRNEYLRALAEASATPIQLAPAADALTAGHGAARGA